MAAVEQARSAGQVEQARREVEAVKRIALRALIIIILLSVLLVVSSAHAWDKPTQKETPTASQIAYARNLYNISGYFGEAKIYIDRWPEYADEIMGGETP